MEASLVVPGALDVAGTLSRFHLWGEDPVNRFREGSILDALGICPTMR